MKHRYTITFSLTIILALICPQVQASHLVGANMSYECLGNNVFRVYFNGYYDCGGGATNTPVGPLNFPPAPILYIQSNGGNCPNPNPIGAGWTHVSYLDVTPVCPGITTECDGTFGFIDGTAEAKFYRDYDFGATICSNTGFTASFASCCRNYGLVNVNPAGFFITMEMDKDPMTCNNSPIFNAPGIGLLCANTATGGMIDLSATDPDGDSLVYTLVDCLDSPGTSLNYNPGFSAINPLGSAWTMSLDAQTGLMTVLPNPTGAIGIYQVCVEVAEYRDGNLLGASTWDMQMESVSCGNEVPVFDSLSIASGGQISGPFTVEVCPGDSLEFTIHFSDLDTADIVYLATNAALALNGATVNTNNPGTATIRWIPDTSDYNTVKTLYITATDDACPVLGKTVTPIYISVGGSCISGIVTNTLCNGSTGGVKITFLGGVGPYNFQWSNGDNNMDLLGVPAGKYWVDVVDAMGSFFSDTFYVNADDLLHNPTYVQPTCNVPTGSISLAPTGGTGPYTYQWNNGTTTATNSSLPAGGYNVLVTDALGCIRYEVHLLDEPDSCFVSIEGTVFDDTNGNCIQDSGEVGLPFFIVDIAPGWATFTDDSGHYRLEVDTGQYTLSVLPQQFRPHGCPASGMFPLQFSDYDADTTGVDFAMDFLVVQDLRIEGFNRTPVPGFTRYGTATVYNHGSIPMSGTLHVIYDYREDSQNALPAVTVDDPLNHKLEWDFNGLPPGSYRKFKYFTLVDQNAIIDSTMENTLWVEPIVGDTTPANNQIQITRVIRASYDPNDKQVKPLGIREPGYILPSQNQMDYSVQFQNTGNFPASFVIIRDTLDGKLDAFSYRPGTSSHPYTLDLEDDTVLVFTFNNINLPDSASDPLGSQGHVSFSLLHRDTLSPGTVIENSAAIYFDFNEPIITNTTVNTIFEYPEVEIVSDSLCEGQTIVAYMPETGMPPYDIAWSTGELGTGLTDNFFTIEADTAGFYSITVTDAFGFVVSDTHAIEVSPLPDAHFTFEFPDPDSLLIQVNNLSLNTDHYFWDLGFEVLDSSGASTILVPYPVDIDSFVIQLIATNACGSDTFAATVSLVSLEAEKFARSVKVIPNPFTQQTEISYANPSGQAFRLSLYDAQGKRVRRYANLRGESVRVAREDLSPGLYVFLLDGPRQFTGKLIIN